jgi:hypothetical protein
LAAFRAARDPNIPIAFSPGCPPAKSDSPLTTITGKPFDKLVCKNHHSLLAIFCIYNKFLLPMIILSAKCKTKWSSHVHAEPLLHDIAINVAESHID